MPSQRSVLGKLVTARNRELLGFVLAPLGTIVLVSAYFLLSDLPSAVFLPLLLLVVYMIEFVLVLPGHNLLRRRGRQSLLAYVLIFAVAGAGPVFILTIINTGPALVSSNPDMHVPASEIPSALIPIGICAAYGAFCAPVFWWIAVRPDATRESVDR